MPERSAVSEPVFSISTQSQSAPFGAVKSVSAAMISLSRSAPMPCPEAARYAVYPSSVFA